MTSRKCLPRICNRMKRDQKFVLNPLCTEDAMVALWRQIRKKETEDADDKEVLNVIKELEKDDEDEYLPLKNLCGDKGDCGLGGLPLALEKAGMFIARFECFFSEYLTMFTNANRIEDMRDIVKNKEEVKRGRELQRSIWSTWDIIVSQLSERAYTVLRAMAFVGLGNIGEAIMKGIVKEIVISEEGSVDWNFKKL